MDKWFVYNTNDSIVTISIRPRIVICAILRLLKVQSFDIADNVTQMHLGYTVLHSVYATIDTVVISEAENSFTLTV